MNDTYVVIGLDMKRVKIQNNFSGIFESFSKFRTSHTITSLEHSNGNM